jgi:prolyl 4-hydroxylase
MKRNAYLALPVLATLVNVPLALLFCGTRKVAAQPVLTEALVGHCTNDDAEMCVFDLESYLDSQLKDDQEKVVPETEEDNDLDPNLQLIPGTNFKAYVRADISTFYGKEPGSRQEKKPDFRGQAGKFVNMSPERVDLWWDGPSGPVLNDSLRPWTSGGTSCFPNHKFIFTKPEKPDEVLCRMTIVPDVAVYYCDPFLPPYEFHTDARARGEQLLGGGRSLDSLSAEDRAHYDAHVYNLEFGEVYKKFTGGSEWLTMYPKNPPRHKIWRADYFGQEHYVQTLETQFIEIPPAEEIYELSRFDMRRGEDESIALSEYRSPGLMNITIKALSCAPRAFEIKNFLSDIEVDHILDIVQQKELERSTTNGHLSSTRTSTTTWLSRNSDLIVDAVFRRVADALRINEALLRDRDADELENFPTRSRINEDLQIVHYDVGQEYQAHHDFSMPKETLDVPGRSINLCLYLNNVIEGGETSFPRWRNAETGESLKVKPEKGKAMIFYMVNPDGNLDDLTQHAALPVIAGEKYFANLWIHDPVRS